MASPEDFATWKIGSPAHFVQGFLMKLEPVLATSSIHAQTNNDEG